MPSLFTELMISEEMKSFVRRSTDYLEKSDKAAEASNELKSNLAAVERMLVG